VAILVVKLEVRGRDPVMNASRIEACSEACRFSMRRGPRTADIANRPGAGPARAAAPCAWTRLPEDRAECMIFMSRSAPENSAESARHPAETGPGAISSALEQSRALGIPLKLLCSTVIDEIDAGVGMVDADLGYRCLTGGKSRAVALSEAPSRSIFLRVGGPRRLPALRRDDSAVLRFMGCDRSRDRP